MVPAGKAVLLPSLETCGPFQVGKGNKCGARVRLRPERMGRKADDGGSGVALPRAECPGSKAGGGWGQGWRSQLPGS